MVYPMLLSFRSNKVDFDWPAIPNYLPDWAAFWFTLIWHGKHRGPHCLPPHPQWTMLTPVSP